MQLLITGATGFIGRNLIDTLVTKPQIEKIYCLVRDAEKAKETFRHVSYPLNFVTGDIMKPDNLSNLPDNITHVYHLAGQRGFEQNKQASELNDQGTATLLKIFSQRGSLARFMFLSSLTAIDRPQKLKQYVPLKETDNPYPKSPYGKSKQQAERLIEGSGIPYTILRPAFVHGHYLPPSSYLGRAILDTHAENPYTKMPFTGSISEIHASDLADIIWEASTERRCQNEAYFVSNPEPVGVQDVFKVIYHFFKKPYHPYPIPKFLLPWLEKAMINEGLSPLLGEILFKPYFVCTPEKLYSHLHYRPYYGFGAGLHRTLQWYRQHNLVSI